MDSNETSRLIRIGDLHLVPFDLIDIGPTFVSNLSALLTGPLTNGLRRAGEVAREQRALDGRSLEGKVEAYQSARRFDDRACRRIRLGSAVGVSGAVVV